MISGRISTRSIENNIGTFCWTSEWKRLGSRTLRRRLTSLRGQVRRFYPATQGVQKQNMREQAKRDFNRAVLRQVGHKMTRRRSVRLPSRFHSLVQQKCANIRAVYFLLEIAKCSKIIAPFDLPLNYPRRNALRPLWQTKIFPSNSISDSPASRWPSEPAHSMASLCAPWRLIVPKLN